MNYLDYCIEYRATVKEAMKKIDITVPKIIFVVDKNILVASITDGDIRRFLLKGGKLEQSVLDASYKHTRYAVNLEEAKKIYAKNHVLAVPVVDENNRIFDIYVGGSESQTFFPQLDISVVINAGGKGTRLEPYTKILPKPLIPVGKLPIMEHIMNQFNKFGCKDFHIIVNYKKSIIKAYFAEAEPIRKVVWYDEEKPLGTGGGLCYLKGKLNQTFFFTNCDNLLLADYHSILRFHRENKNVITMICAYKHVAIPYGVVDMGENGIIKSMKEKPEFSFLTNTGIYLVEPEVLEDIENEVFIGFPDIIEQERKLGKKVAVYPVNENEWLDMGQMPELEKMRAKMELM